MGLSLSRKKSDLETNNEIISANEAIDKTSELPESIILHIQSFLNTKEATQSTILSKSWLRAWSTRPFLDFDQTHFGFLRFQNNHNPLMEDKLFNVITETIENHQLQRIPIQKFRLHVNIIPGFKLFPLIKWVFQNGLMELDLNIRWEGSGIPPELFGTTSVQVLKVTSQLFWPKLVLNSTDYIKCRKLKKLKIKGIGIDAVTFHNISCGCPLIEELELKDCGWLEICIANLPNLKILRVEGLGVNIDAPKLQSLTCRTTGVFKLVQSGDLIFLSFSDLPISDDQLSKILSKNPHIEDLTICRCINLERVNLSNLFLKRFSIKGCQKLAEVIIDAPNLHFFKCDISSTTLIPTVKTPTSKGKSDISISCIGEISASWFYTLRDILTRFCQSNIEISSYGDIKFDSEGFRGIPLTHGHEVEILKLTYQQLVNIDHFYGLLSICHPKTILCEYAEIKPNNDAFMKKICKEMRNARNSKCCSEDQIKCWRHYVKDSMFQIVDEGQRFWGFTRIKTIAFTFEWKS